MTQAKFSVLLIALITTFNGCASLGKNIVLHPVEKSDIFSMTKGQAYIPEKDGWFLSDYTMKEIENAKVETLKKAA